MDADYPLVVWHDGQPTEAGTAVTAATITVTADTSLTLGINGAADSRVGSTGVIAHATWGTWGAIADEINRAQGWHARLRDARRANLPDHMSTMSETSCFQTHVGVPQDTSDDGVFGAGISNWKYGTSQKNAVCALYYFYALVTDSGTPYVHVYDCDDVNHTDQLVFKATIATTVAYPFPVYGPTGHPIYVAKPGHRIVVQTVGAGSGQPSASQLYVIGGVEEVGA